ncbi:DUF1661 domain-containing protein [Porphyromonas gulae]|uniref:DUF1661 domain-containing protein n=1 Tax=Porphyromonas gulae TaxID=111105 RepID=UPI001F26F227|nr:DUF1661 domain-containing protein [Porphyromonas gulae]
MAREVKNLRATAKKISRHFSRKHAPQSQHFRSVNFGEADLSAKKKIMPFGLTCSPFTGDNTF